MFDIEQIGANLIYKNPFFSNIISNVIYVSDSSIESAVTDGKKIVYNDNYMSSLSSSQQEFVLMHELCHIAFNHLSIMNRANKSDRNIWNYVMDAVINQHLKNDNYDLTADCINIPEAIKYNIVEFFEIFNNNMTFDSESDLITYHGENGIDYFFDASSANDYVFWENVDTDLEKFISDLIEEDAFSENASIRSKLAGNSTFSLNVNLDTDFSKKSNEIPWQKILRDLFFFEFDWSYKQIVIENNLIKPSFVVEDEKFKTEIIIDTSGSIYNDDIMFFLQECLNLLKNNELRVGCCDTEFYGFESINNKRDLESFTILGRGGTNFQVMADSFSFGDINRIILTDGYAKLPITKFPINWVILELGNKDFKPQFGNVIHINNKKKVRRK